MVLKDRNGPLQYLLMPTAKITGIESPQVLQPDTANFFALAWQARHFMADKLGKPIDDAAISLAINSEYGRTQNQLHIHISCLQPAVKPGWHSCKEISAKAGSRYLVDCWGMIIWLAAPALLNSSSLGHSVCWLRAMRAHVKAWGATAWR